MLTQDVLVAIEVCLNDHSLKSAMKEKAEELLAKFKPKLLEKLEEDILNNNFDLKSVDQIAIEIFKKVESPSMSVSLPRAASALKLDKDPSNQDPKYQKAYHKALQEAVGLAASIFLTLGLSVVLTKGYLNELAKDPNPKMFPNPTPERLILALVISKGILLLSYLYFLYSKKKIKQEEEAELQEGHEFLKRMPPHISDEPTNVQIIHDPIKGRVYELGKYGPMTPNKRRPR